MPGGLLGGPSGENTLIMTLGFVVVVVGVSDRHKKGCFVRGSNTR